MGGGTCHAKMSLLVTRSQEKNLKKFDIPFGCNMNELKDLIKQVAPHVISPYGIHETQTVRRLFFGKPSHHEYLEKVIKFEIIELKTNDEVIKVLIESNYWKKIGLIEILILFDYVEDNVLFEFMYHIIILFLFFWKWKTTCCSLLNFISTITFLSVLQIYFKYKKNNYNKRKITINCKDYN